MERSRILSFKITLLPNWLLRIHLCTPSFYIGEDDPEGEEILRREWEEGDRETALERFSRHGARSGRGGLRRVLGIGHGNQRRPLDVP
jgi:hypothetical protein